MDKKTEIKDNISMDVFKETTVAKKVKELFMNQEKIIKGYLNSIFDTYELCINYMFPRDDIFLSFKEKFLMEILNEAVETTSSNKREDVVESLLALLTPEKVEEAFFGKVMDDTFMDFIKSLSDEDVMSTRLAGEMIASKIDELDEEDE